MKLEIFSGWISFFKKRSEVEMDGGYEVQTTRDKVYVYDRGQLVARLCKVSAEYLDEFGWSMLEKPTFEDFKQACSEKFRLQLTDKEKPAAFKVRGA